MGTASARPVTWWNAETQTLRRSPAVDTDMSTPDEAPASEYTPLERDLGMDTTITRRDFLNTVALGTGAALLTAAAPSLRRPGAPDRPGFASSEPSWRPWTGGDARSQPSPRDVGRGGNDHGGTVIVAQRRIS